MSVVVNMSSVAKEICSLAFFERCLVVVMLWVRFLCARAVAEGEMSMPWRWRDGMDGERRECRWRGMQPVPVQRSRMRRVLERGEERRWDARWVVMFSVSGLQYIIVT